MFDIAIRILIQAMAELSVSVSQAEEHSPTQQASPQQPTEVQAWFLTYSAQRLQTQNARFILTQYFHASLSNSYAVFLVVHHKADVDSYLRSSIV